MAHAAIPFTDQGSFTGESITNIICPSGGHASKFEQLRSCKKISRRRTTGCNSFWILRPSLRLTWNFGSFFAPLRQQSGV